MFPSTPTIDLAPLFAARPGARTATQAESVTEAMVAALESHGSFVAIGFPAAAGLDRRMERLLGFFALAEEARMACAVAHYRPANSNFYRGFYPLGCQDGWLRKEHFDIGPEPPLACPDGPGAAAFREDNVWPVPEPVAGWRQAMLGLLDDGRALALALMAAIARGLDLEPERLLAPARGRNATLRLLHYAPQESPPEPAHDDSASDGEPHTIARRHVDTGLLSLIWQDPAGLQMQAPDGSWREVPTVADSLSVHCGDLMEPLSGGRLVGTPHRAVADDRSERFSISYFLEPDFATETVPGTCYAHHLAGQFPGRFDPPLAA